MAELATPINAMTGAPWAFHWQTKVAGQPTQQWGTQGRSFVRAVQRVLRKLLPATFTAQANLSQGIETRSFQRDNIAVDGTPGPATIGGALVLALQLGAPRQVVAALDQAFSINIESPRQGRTFFNDVHLALIWLYHEGRIPLAQIDMPTVSVPLAWGTAPQNDPLNPDRVAHWNRDTDPIPAPTHGGSSSSPSTTPHTTPHTTVPGVVTSPRPESQGLSTGAKWGIGLAALATAGVVVAVAASGPKKKAARAYA